MTRTKALLMALALVAVSAAFADWKVFVLGRQLDSLVKQQGVNRTENVAVWCQAINEGRVYDRLFVQRVTHQRVTYALGDLPCAALERHTLASSKTR